MVHRLVRDLAVTTKLQLTDLVMPPRLPDAVEDVPLARLIPYARNARTHDDEQVAKIAASIVEFGWLNPVLVDDGGNVIAGHGRLLAAQKLGLEFIPVIRASHLTPAQVQAYRLVDNRLAELSGWDDVLLSGELHALNDLGFDLSLAGFDEADFDRLMAPLEEIGAAEDEDELPEPPAEPVTRTGDLWLLGKHRLLCGDATNAADVGRLLDGAKPHLLVSDPPYGVDYDPNWRNKAGVSATARTGKVTNDDRADWRAGWALFNGDVAYVWHAGVHARTVAESLEASGFQIRAQIIWAKPRFVLGRGDYHWQHEPCFYAVRKGATGHSQGARDQSTLWTIATGENDQATEHATQKPVECMRRPIINNSAKGDFIYEPFAGSGSTLIAAETVGRVCLAMEIDPRYCDVIVERWQRHTGGDAILAGNDCSFAEIAAERLRVA